MLQKLQNQTLIVRTAPIPSERPDPTKNSLKNQELCMLDRDFMSLDGLVFFDTN
jgi:hypothetical protein